LNPIIQIAGVIDLAEAELLVREGANWLGFPLRVPDGREDLSETDAKEIIKILGARANTVLITYLNNSAEIIDFCDYLGVSGLQLHGPIACSELAAIRTKRPNLFLIKSLVVGADNTPELKTLVQELGSCVDAFLTDTYDPATGRSGATGKTHDWSVSRQLVRVSPKPVILAGGLDPGNVRDAILEVRPAGVDSHSRVEGRDGRKDLNLVSQFVAEANRAFGIIMGKAV
jgi:phosphoribosylanthranilate isomerase